MPFVSNESINGSRFPYERCLIPNLPEDVQHHVRAITNFFVVPFDMLLAVLSFIANSLVLTAIVRTKALQTPAQLMLCSLSVTDLLWGVISLVRNLSRVTAQHMCREPFKELTSLAALLITSTMGNLAVISRDRYLAVSRTWWYRTHVTPALVMKKTMAVWLYSTVYAVMLGITNQLPNKIGSLLIILGIVGIVFDIVCILVILSSYIGIFVASWRHKRNMPQEGAHVRSMLTREKKMANTVGLILLVLLFTFLPALISPLVIVLVHLRSGMNINYLPYRPLYVVFITLNGLLNPLLNFGRNQDVRKAVRNLIGCHQGNQQIVPLAVPCARDNEEIIPENPTATMDT